MIIIKTYNYTSFCSVKRNPDHYILEPPSVHNYNNTCSLQHQAKVRDAVAEFLEKYNVKSK